MNTDVSRTDLAYLHGLRVLSLFWIILIHLNIQAANGSWPYGKWIKAVAENNCVSRVLKTNSQTRSECFKYCDWMKVLAASLRVGLCDEWKKALTPDYRT